MMNTNSITLNCATISSVENQIIYTRFHEAEIFDMVDAHSLNEARIKIAKGKPCYSLVSLENIFGHMTSEAQQYLARECLSSQLIQAEAIIINTLPMRILVHYYLKKFSPLFSVKIVKNYDAGLTWLREFSKNNTNQ